MRTSIRSSLPEVLCKKGALRNFAKFTGKHLCQSLFFNKVVSLSLQLYQKRDSDTTQQAFVLMKTSWRRLLSSSSEDVFKTSWRRLGRRKNVMLKTFWRHVLKTSSRRLKDQQMFAGKCFSINFAKFPRTPFLTKHL